MNIYPRSAVASKMGVRRTPLALLSASGVTFAGISSLQAPTSKNHEPGILDLSNLHNYARQPVPAHVSKDNTPKDNPITDEGATLGRVLFYDKKLSYNDTISCASCHQQAFAFSDRAERSEGVDKLQTERHSMRLVNIRFARETRVRWDKSAGTLEKQTTLPIHAHEEMGYSGQEGRPRFETLIAKLEKSTYYPPLFKLAFGDERISEERMQLALAQFVRSIQSFDSKYDEGRARVESNRDDFPNFTEDENGGKRLFMEDYSWAPAEHTPAGAASPISVSKRVKGGLNCASCHRAPEFDIDPASGPNGFVGSRTASVRGRPVSRAPSLRDLVNPAGQLNGGLFHAGEAMRLEALFDNYDLSPNRRGFGLDPRLRPDGLPQFLNTTPREREQVVAFLRTLTGKNVYTDPKWSDPFDAKGNLLLTK